MACRLCVMAADSCAVSAIRTSLSAGS